MLLFSLKNTCKKVYLKMRRVLNKIQERAQNINVKLSELSHCECPQMQHSDQNAEKLPALWSTHLCSLSIMISSLSLGARHCPDV